MPEEVMVIVIIAIVMGTVTSMTKMILAHRERTAGLTKSSSRSSSSESSVTTSELERMMHRAVRKATDPLADRLDALEDRLDMPALPEAEPRIDLEAVLDEEQEPAMAPRRSRTR